MRKLALAGTGLSGKSPHPIPLKHPPSTSGHPRCCKPHLSTSGATTFCPISDNPAPTTSQRPTSCNPSDAHLHKPRPVFFKANCNICCSMYAFLNHFTWGSCVPVFIRLLVFFSLMNPGQISQCFVSHPGSLNLGTSGILGWIILYRGEGPVDRRMFSNIPGLCPPPSLHHCSPG